MTLYLILQRVLIEAALLLLALTTFTLLCVCYLIEGGLISYDYMRGYFK